MSSLMMYFLVMADNLSNMLQILIVAFTVLFGLSLFIFIVGIDDIPNKKRFLKYVFIMAILDIFSIFGYAFIPNTKQLAAIILVPKIYNAIVENKEIQKMPDNIVKLANDWIETLKPQVKEESDGNKKH